MKGFYILALAAIISFAAILLPEPYSKVGFLFMVLGIFIVIMVGHKSAFRQNKHGVFSQYTNPKLFSGMTLSRKELTLFAVGVGLAIGFLVGLACKVKALSVI